MFQKVIPFSFSKLNPPIFMGMAYANPPPRCGDVEKELLTVQGELPSLILFSSQLVSGLSGKDSRIGFISAGISSPETSDTTVFLQNTVVIPASCP